MKTSKITKHDLERSVISVPPLCRNADLKVDAAQNKLLIKHIESGGVSSLLYGGNANFYNISLTEYDETLDVLEAAAGADTWVIPSVGPFFGTAMDQAAILSKRKFPTAMLLPTLAVSSPKGVESAVLKFVERAGIPAVLYIKDDGYVNLQVVVNLVKAGVISWIKYAVVRKDPSVDPLLRSIVDNVDPSIVVGGIGEQPTLAHWHGFGLRTFTSGCVCVAPRRSQELLGALHRGDFTAAESIRLRFEELENLRNAHGPIPVLHAAVAHAGVAQTGPMLPLLSELSDSLHAEIKAAATNTLHWNAS
jgi:dihydrodipicolinate synthase/N-acetylneuraminate lyase